MSATCRVASQGRDAGASQVRHSRVAALSVAKFTGLENAQMLSLSISHREQTMQEPWMVEVMGAKAGRGWIPVITVPTNNRKDARRWLHAQGYRWMDRKSAPDPRAVREWRIVPNAHAATRQSA